MKNTLWGGGDDGEAVVVEVFTSSNGQNKLVKFVSIEAKKVFIISRPHFLARFPERIN